MTKLTLLNSLLLVPGVVVAGSSDGGPGRRVRGCPLGGAAPRPLVPLVPLVPLLQELRLRGAPVQAPGLPLLPGL